MYSDASNNSGAFLGLPAYLTHETQSSMDDPSLELEDLTPQTGAWLDAAKVLLQNRGIFCRPSVPFDANGEEYNALEEYNASEGPPRRRSLSDESSGASTICTLRTIEIPQLKRKTRKVETINPVNAAVDKVLKFVLSKLQMNGKQERSEEIDYGYEMVDSEELELLLRTDEEWVVITTSSVEFTERILLNLQYWCAACLVLFLFLSVLQHRYGVQVFVSLDGRSAQQITVML